MQKFPSEKWLAEIREIYTSYEAYHQAEGNEQLSLDRRAGALRRRSAILIDRLTDQFGLPANGTVLDVGCGSGVTLRFFSEKRPEWYLEGYELDEGNVGKLRALHRFGKLHTGSIGGIRSRYELVTMIHSLEHFTDPAATLGAIRSLLADDGLLFIEVCNIEENPFDILVADHLVHFSPATLGTLLSRSGLNPIEIATDWVGREISAMAAITGEPVEQTASGSPVCGWARLDSTVSWLEHFVEIARNAALRNASFGIFGTSISGTWLASQLGDSVAFFVDEDPSRIGRTLLGRPILSPGEVSPQATVFLALSPTTARLVQSRFRDHRATWLLPPGEPF